MPDEFWNLILVALIVFLILFCILYQIKPISQKMAESFTPKKVKPNHK
jgi:hypothetical protein